MKSLGNPAIAVAYLRVSTEEQRLGPEAQRAQIELWAQREGVRVAEWCLDQGVSGASKAHERPGLVRALAAVREVRAGWLVVAKRDRIARDVEVSVVIEQAVRKARARIACADGSPVGDEPGELFMRRIGDAASEYERGLIVARTKAALAVKRARGEMTGKPLYGTELGPDGKTLVPNAYEQQVIARARELDAQRFSFRYIAATLTAEGYRTRSGTAFAHNQVIKMLRRSERAAG